MTGTGNTLLQGAYITHDVTLCYLKVDLDYLEMCDVNSRTTSTILLKSLIDTLRGFKMESYKMLN